MAFLPVPTWQGGKIVAGTSANIISPKQYDNPVKTEADSIKNTFQQTAYWVNAITRDITSYNLNEYAQLLTLNFEQAFLRSGFIIQEYGRIYPEQTPTYPTVGSAIAPTRGHIPTIFQDLTGKQMIKLTAKVDFVKYQNKEVFIDIDNYTDYFRKHATMVGTAFARTLNATAGIIACAPFGWTMTTDVDIAPYFNTDAKPEENDSPAANEWFKDNNFYFKWLKDEVIAQIQKKKTNKGYYSPELYSPWNESFELKAVTTPTLPNNDINNEKQIYFLKDNAKQKTKKDINRFTSLVALVQHATSVVEAMTTSASPMNMMFYTPYSSTKQTEYQISKKAEGENLVLLFNCYDLADADSNITNTSPYGNYSTSLARVRSKGVKVIGLDTIPPGHFTIGDHRLEWLPQIFQQTYHLDFSFNTGEQFGGHLFFKYYLNKLGCFYAGIPTSFVPSQNYLTHHYNALKIS